MTQPLQHLHTKILTKQQHLGKIIVSSFGEQFVPTIEIAYDIDSIRILGKCKKIVKNGRSHHKISLNPDLLNELKDKYVDHVFVHEYAHACVDTIYRGVGNRGYHIKPHGREFKHVCSMFGIDGGATTSLASDSQTLNQLKSSRTPAKTYSYACNCSQHELSAVRHRRTSSGQASYRCSSCRGKLVPVE
jgi:SprT protein